MSKDVWQAWTSVFQPIGGEAQGRTFGSLADYAAQQGQSNIAAEYARQQAYLQQALNQMPSMLPQHFSAKSAELHPSKDAIRIRLDTGGEVLVPTAMLRQFVKDRIVTKHTRRPSFWRMLCVIGLHWPKWKPGKMGEPMRGRCVRCRQWQVK